MSTLAKPSNELVVDLINADNGSNFAYDELVLSPPVQNDIVNYNRNTSVIVTASNLFQFDGSQTFYYNRVDFSDLFEGLSIVLGGQGLSDISGLLPELNATFGLGLTMTDLQSQPFPSNPTWPLTLTIVASPTSYAYTGQFSVTVQNIPPTMGDNLSNVVIGNIGDDSTDLEQAISDLNNLSAAFIDLNNNVYDTNNLVRSLNALVQQNAQTDIQQALDISSLNDSVRELEASVSALTSDQGSSNAAQNTLASAVTALQNQQTSDKTNIAANASALAALTTQVSGLANMGPQAGTVTVTTPSSAQSTGVVSIAKLAILLSMQTDVPCRVRLYPTTTERDLDLTRDSTTPAPPGLGQLFEGITTNTMLFFYTGPTPFLYNGNTPTDDTIAYTIEPTVTGVVNVTFNFYSLLK